MRFRRKIYAAVVEWHRWFAWCPVPVGDEGVWIEVVARRRTVAKDRAGRLVWVNEYRSTE